MGYVTLVRCSSARWPCICSASCCLLIIVRRFHLMRRPGLSRWPASAVSHRRGRCWLALSAASGGGSSCLKSSVRWVSTRRDHEGGRRPPPGGTLTSVTAAPPTRPTRANTYYRSCGYLTRLLHDAVDAYMACPARAGCGLPDLASGPGALGDHGPTWPITSAGGLSSGTGPTVTSAD